MRTVGIRDLKDNPTRALRAAREQPVLITNRDDPEALLLSLRGLAEHEPDVRLTLATTLFDQAGMSLGRAARLAGMSIEAFINHLGSRGIAVFRQSRDDLAGDLRALDE
jgi:predicted HTH domain antitoxin